MAQPRTRAERAAQALARSRHHRFLHLSTRILVHDHRVELTGRRCPCCRSPYAEIVETIPDLDLFVDVVTGERYLRTPDNQKAFDRLAARAHRIDLPFRCHRKQLDGLVDDSHKVVIASSGNRAGKTEIGACRAARRWILRGGKGARFALVSPEMRQTQIWVRKLLLGEFSDVWKPPILPVDGRGTPILATSWPEKHTATDQKILMVDGSEFWLGHAQYYGENWRGWSFVDVFLDEVSAVKNQENYTILLARTIDSNGTIFLPTTPARDMNHWFKTVVDTAELEGDQGDKLNLKFSAADNPWLPPGSVERMRAEAGDELTARREVDGEWVGSRGSLWKHFDEQIHTRDGAGYQVEEYFEGARNVTQQATRKHWRHRNPYTRRVVEPNELFVAGMDFNTWPMSAIVGQVFGDPGEPGTWRLFIVDEVQLGTEGRGANAKMFGEWLAYKRAERTRRPSYPDLRISCDPSGAYFAVDSLKSTSRKSAVDAKQISEAGHDCRPCRYSIPQNGKGDPYPDAPPVHDSVSLVESLFREDRLFIHGRCRQLILALQTQEDRGDGTPQKVSGTASDRLSSPTDALRYLVWPIFHPETDRRGLRQGTRKTERSH